MKIAVYGDSFGCFNLDKTNKKHTAWPEILKTHGYTLDNRSIIGNTFFRTYQKFKEQHEEYDVNIVLLPRLGRHYLERMPEPLFKYIAEESSVQIDRMTLNSLQKYSDSLREIASELLTWAELSFKYQINLEQEEFLRKELLMYSKTFKNHTIFIPCVDECVPGADKTQTLLDVFNFENQCLNAVLDEFRLGTVVGRKFLKDKRVCHFSDGNNLMIATKIIDAIKYKKDTITINVNDMKIPHGSIDDYFEWKTVV